jgi:hypothetical protein
MSKRRRIDSLGSRSSRNLNAALMQCSGVCISIVNRLQVSLPIVMRWRVSPVPTLTRTSNSSGSPSPVRSTLITACLHRSRFNSVVVDPNTWADDSKKSCAEPHADACRRFRKFGCGWGKAVTSPRYQSYDFQRIHRIVGSDCAVERDRDCGPFLGRQFGPVPVGNLIRLASEAESRNVSIL